MSENNITLKGVVVEGHGVASGQGEKTPYPGSALELQSPHFAAGGLDLSSYHLGTINVSISPHTIKRLHAPYCFELVEWTHLHPPETFSFAPCQIIYQGQTYDGLVYYPHPETKLDHFQDPSILEILTSFVPGIKVGDSVQVSFNTEEIIIDDS